jgi:tetratricopeptide (TPR) repeat protein
MRLAAGRPADALGSLDRFLEGEPDHAEASLYRARALAALGRREEAARAYTRSIEKASTPAPDTYLERAELFRTLGRGDDALRGLDEGLARLGPAAALDLRALEIETELERWDDALRRVERRLRSPGRAEEWQLRRAELLRRLGRGDEAEAACRAALASIAALPPSRRDTPATADLERRLRALLAR